MSGDDVIYLDGPGPRRRYVAHPPASGPAGPWPVVVMLDGRGGTPWTAMKTTGWSAQADRAGFLALYPEALRLNPAGPQHFLDNPQMWNAGGDASDGGRAEVDDAGFLAAVLDDVAGRYPVDLQSIFMTGFSNGAAMTYRFAVEHGDRVAAIAPVAGHLRAGASPAAARRVPMISFWGGRDPLSPFAGGTVTLPWGATEPRPPAMESIRAWAARNGHDPDVARHAAEDGVETWRWSDGRGGDVEFTLVGELGHVWPGGHRLIPERLVGASSSRVDATAAIWEFFRRQAAAGDSGD